MKKKLLLFAAFTICASIAGAGTYAFFNSENTAHNIITTSGVSIEIEEWQKDGDDLVEYPSDEELEAMPGCTISKIATIKNKEAESYVRAKFKIVITNSEGEEMDISPETLASIVSLTMDGDDWVHKQGDGVWWYYSDSVGTDESTEPLFTEVVFDGPNMTNEYQNCKVEVIVQAQAVQAANNGASAIEAEGWPEE